MGKRERAKLQRRIDATYAALVNATGGENRDANWSDVQKLAKDTLAGLISLMGERGIESRPTIVAYVLMNSVAGVLVTEDDWDERIALIRMVREHADGWLAAHGDSGQAGSK